jgi:hypothetical protein
LNINKSENIAPMPPIKEANKIFFGLKTRKKPAAIGEVNPNENKSPAINTPRYPKSPNSEMNKFTFGSLKRK